MYELKRNVDVLRKTQVLVVGGGSAGVAAAVMAARNGAEVLLLERYNHFGGQATGGLVLWLDGYAEDGVTTCRGFGEETADRLEKLGGLDRPAHGQNGTTDAEIFKQLLLEMCLEAKVEILLHITAIDIIMDGGTPKGVITWSKAGFKAIEADIIIDCSGDGDMYAAAGAEFHVKKSHAGLPFRIGGVDGKKFEAFRKTNRDELSRIYGEIQAAAAGVKPTWRPAVHPSIGWVNVVGPRIDNLDVAELTRAELECRFGAWKALEMARKMIPGYENAFMVETAPQLGGRISRMTVNSEEVRGPHDDAVGFTWHLEVPYWALIPKKTQGMLAAGRCVLDAIRCIPSCFVMGHAAGTAAALSLHAGVTPAKLDVAVLQKRLKEENVYFKPRQ